MNPAPESSAASEKSPDNPVSAPQAERMSLEVWEHSYKDTDKKIRVPLMKTGEAFPDPEGGTILPASNPTAKLYMEARESMGKVITSGGNVTGSGFFLNKDGLSSTAYHVTEDNPVIAVLTGDGKMYRARIVEKNPADDLVLLQVEKNNKNDTFKPLTVAASSELKPGEPVLACGFGDEDVLHCSPGIYDFTVQQKDIKLRDSEPYLDPNRELVHAKQHTVNGDSGGLEFRLSDGTVRLLVDMSDNSKHTLSIPAEKLLELEASHEKHTHKQ